MKFSRVMVGALLCGALQVGLSAQEPAPEGNARRGKRFFAAQCVSCHAETDENRSTGPALAGVVGRRAGTLEGFAFSDAMKKAGLVWTPENLERYLADPVAVVPGTTMISTVPAPATRADLIAYLGTLGAAK